MGEGNELHQVIQNTRVFLGVRAPDGERSAKVQMGELVNVRGGSFNSTQLKRE